MILRRSSNVTQSTNIDEKIVALFRENILKLLPSFQILISIRENLNNRTKKARDCAAGDDLKGWWYSLLKRLAYMFLCHRSVEKDVSVNEMFFMIGTDAMKNALFGRANVNKLECDNESLSLCIGTARITLLLQLTTAQYL